jgi:RAD51-like protein 2
MQLSVNVNLPPSSGGLSSTAVYIDAEGSLIPERLLSIADNVIRSHNLSEFLSVADILQNILIFRVHDFVEQLAVTCDFEKLISEHPTIKLIIIDSVAFHFRHEFDDASVRSKLLSMYAQRLSEIARAFKIAVVVINQVTTRVKAQSGSVVPALGETWAHNCAHRAMLQWQGQLRVASLVKSSRLPPAKAAFAISGHGIVRKEQGMPADLSAISE